MIEGTTTTEYALLEDSIVKEIMENEPLPDKFTLSCESGLLIYCHDFYQIFIY
jgi:hypothetical protein